MLELIHVTKCYGKEKAVDDLSFVAKEGEITGLIGANGAGKTTTVSMLATLSKPTAGDILYRESGKEAVSICRHPEILRCRLGYVPQEIALYESLSGYDNLFFWAKAYHVPAQLLQERIQKAMYAIGFSEEQVNLRKRVSTYSIGMKRRLNLGVCLLAEPKVLLLDEPTVGIDFVSRRRILDTVKELAKQGATIIFVGHYMEEVAKLCDQICVMDHGRLYRTVYPQKELAGENGGKTLEALVTELTTCI